MDRAREIMEVNAKIARCQRLAREFPDGVTATNLRELTRELQEQLKTLETSPKEN
jgi:hypothetical protein